jgi:hypothetical protein
VLQSEGYIYLQRSNGSSRRPSQPVSLHTHLTLHPGTRLTQIVLKVTRQRLDPLTKGVRTSARGHGRGHVRAYILIDMCCGATLQLMAGADRERYAQSHGSDMAHRALQLGS